MTLAGAAAANRPPAAADTRARGCRNARRPECAGRVHRSPRPLSPESGERRAARRPALRSDLQNDARRDAHEQIVATDADPVIAARRRRQMVPAPVVDHVLAVPVFVGQALSAAPRGVFVAAMLAGAGAVVAVLAVIAPDVLAGRRPVAFVTRPAGAMGLSGGER
ncbi:hypothetical protein DM49_3660 [Burkholderia mallei]|nr:hypothetical protein DM49_3660 [Burkholderia mallei]KOT11108.1 hypothetical protein DM77_3015 [Burkholderia mallei]